MEKERGEKKDVERNEGQKRALRRFGGKDDTGGDKFIQGAIKRPGALTAKANAAGQSVAGFAAAHEHDSGRTGDEARFYNHVLKKV